MRPDQRPVRPAPSNCRVPLRRPSVAPFTNALYLEVLVVLACNLMRNSSFKPSGISGSARRRSNVEPCKSGKDIKYSPNMCSSRALRLVALDTSPLVTSKVRLASLACSFATASITDSAKSKSTLKPLSLMRWSRCQRSSSNPE